METLSVPNTQHFRPIILYHFELFLYMYICVMYMHTPTLYTTWHIKEEWFNLLKNRMELALLSIFDIGSRAVYVFSLIIPAKVGYTFSRAHFKHNIPHHCARIFMRNTLPLYCVYIMRYNWIHYVFLLSVPFTLRDNKTKGKNIIRSERKAT